MGQKFSRIENETVVVTENGDGINLKMVYGIRRSGKSTELGIGPQLTYYVKTTDDEHQRIFAAWTRCVSK